MKIVFPLSNLVPLRRTTAWGSFAVDKALPVPYGPCRITPVPADRDGYTFLLADCIISGCPGVTRDNVPEYAYTFRHGPDATGRMVAWLILNRPLKPNESLAASVLGKLHPRTGAMLVNPADILWDFLSSICGLPITEADVSAFHAQCSGAGLELAGVIQDSSLTIKSTLDGILHSSGAMWSGAMTGVARLHPVPLEGLSPAYVFDAGNMQHPKAVTLAMNLYTELSIPYATDWSTGNTLRAVIVGSPQSVARYGNSRSDFKAPWIVRPRQALGMATLKLQYMARPVWSVTWESGLDCRRLLPGDPVSISHPLLPVSGLCTLLDMDVNIFAGTVNLTTEIPAGNPPSIELVGSASAWAPVAIDGVTIQYTNGVASFSILDDQGNPLAGATVTMDGGTKRTTDKAGRVQFSVGRGQHVLQISAQGYAPFEASVTV